jgi:MFS family permease
VSAADRPRPAPARLYYGWVLVGVLSLTETISYGILSYAFPVFLQPMERELGWSRVEMTGAFSLSLLVSGVAAIPIGRWVDRHGARALMSFGSLAAALLVLAWARVGSLPAFYAIWVALGFVQAAVLYEPAFAVIATWFVRHRGRALTVLTFLAGFASVIFLPLSSRLVETLGWRSALVALAGILVIGTFLPHAFLLRRRPADLGLVFDGGSVAVEGAPAVQPETSVATREALRSRSFRWLAAAFFLSSLTTSAVFVHLIPALTEWGYAPAFAAAATGMIGTLGLPGRLVFTPLGTRWSRPGVTAGIFALQAAGLAVLLATSGRGGVWAFVILFGAGFGAITPARAALVAEYYGAANYGTISGILALILAVARAAAPVGSSVLYTAAGGYGAVMWALAGASALAAGAILLAEPRRRATPEFAAA